MNLTINIFHHFFHNHWHDILLLEHNKMASMMDPWQWRCSNRNKIMSTIMKYKSLTNNKNGDGNSHRIVVYAFAPFCLSLLQGNHALLCLKLMGSIYLFEPEAKFRLERKKIKRAHGYPSNVVLRRQKGNWFIDLKSGLWSSTEQWCYILEGCRTVTDRMSLNMLNL